MITRKVSRRHALTQTGFLVGATVMGQRLSEVKAAAQPQGQRAGRPFLFSLNMATLRGQKLGIVKEVETTAKAGYDAIEPWVDTLQEYVRGGGSLKDLG